MTSNKICPSITHQPRAQRARMHRRIICIDLNLEALHQCRKRLQTYVRFRQPCFQALISLVCAANEQRDGRVLVTCATRAVLILVLVCHTNNEEIVLCSIVFVQFLEPREGFIEATGRIKNEKH